MRHAATAVCWLSTAAIFRQPSILRNLICPLATRLNSRTTAASSLGSEPCVFTEGPRPPLPGLFNSQLAEPFAAVLSTLPCSLTSLLPISDSGVICRFRVGRITKNRYSVTTTANSGFSRLFAEPGGPASSVYALAQAGRHRCALRGRPHLRRLP